MGESYEHDELGNSVQTMIDAWAYEGLIGGGAFIGSLAGPQESWAIYPDSRSVTKPFLNVPVLGNVHWHYIFPNPHTDKTGEFWTSGSLRLAIASGEAAAVNIGQILMLAGDYFATFGDMEQRTPRVPIHIMKGFHERDRFAGMILDVLSLSQTSPRLGVQNIGFLEQLGALRWMQDIASRHKEQPFNKLDGIVKTLRSLAGPTRFSEIHLLANLMLCEPDKSGKLPLSADLSLLSRAPWMTKTELQDNLDLLNNNCLSVNDMAELFPMDPNFFSTVVTNGHYMQLAQNNISHFYPANLGRFSEYHAKSLEGILSAVDARNATPIPARSVALTAFALHYFTDSFFSGHMRVPRDKLGTMGSLAAKVMHDMDGLYGLAVTDKYHKNAIWRAFGDSYLDRAPDKTATESALQATQGSQYLVNRGRVLYAVGSAFKQLHYLATSRIRKAPSWASTLRLTERFVGEDPERYASNDSSQDISRLLDFLRSLCPAPRPVGMDKTDNHPPLHNRDGSLNSDAVADSVQIGYFKSMDVTRHKQFLDLSWHYSDEVQLDTSREYYLAKFSHPDNQDKHAQWLSGGETVLEKDFTQLKDENVLDK